MAEAKVGKLEALRARHRREERALVREALVAADWAVHHEAAEALGIAKSSLQYIVKSDPELSREWRAKVRERRKRRIAALQRGLDAARRGLEA